jgi:hypothetical protein
MRFLTIKCCEKNHNKIGLKNGIITYQKIHKEILKWQK